MSKLDNLYSKSITDLHQIIDQCKKEIFQMRMQRSTGQEYSKHMFKVLRKKIARAKTAVNQKLESK
ncbi:50S ribosomal protein L29 [Candidatus Comchoanobacter bicostacola]|uniref:Large ribosomal subunit protein uL29 n=1 Tax=Candidatus Comchoanobacter bicostacola TaxID=2919598 RepID=A0ABY5DJ82_9GAMM|nr:50S ribosomal protein L29 [Candidatus Comchoanobacter bicostacola]UTC24290.1 50S ribosomal protein L29 [Candidatus Comchoanobacter bicostacola]